MPFLDCECDWMIVLINLEREELLVSICSTYGSSGFVVVYSSLLGMTPLEVLNWYRVILVVEIKGLLVLVSDRDIPSCGDC